MKTDARLPADIDAYIAAQPPPVRPLLQRLRETVKAAAPEVSEAIKYGMPTFVLDGNLCYFAAFKKHIGFFSTTTAGGTLSAEMAPFANEKGNLQFPYDESIPFDLITKIVKAKVIEQRAKSAQKAAKKTVTAKKKPAAAKKKPAAAKKKPPPAKTKKKKKKAQPR